MEAEASPTGASPAPADTGAPLQPVGPSPDAAPTSVPTPLLTDRLQAAGEVVLCSGFPTQLLLILVLAVLGLQPLDPGGQLSLAYVAILSMLDAGLLITLILFFIHSHGETPRGVFLGDRPVGREVGLGVLCTPAVIFLAAATLVVIQRLAPWMHDVPRNPLEELISSPAAAALFIAIAVIAGGLREEMQRAFVLRRFEQHLGGAAVGLVLFSLAFGAGHLLQGQDAAVATAVLGAAWGLLYLARRSVVAAVVSHSAFNVIEILHHAGTV